MAVAEIQGQKLVTAEELLLMPEADRYELVKGQLVEMSPPPGFEHGAITYRLSFQIGSYVLQQRLGIVVAAETGFRLTRRPDTVRAVDVAYVSAARLPSVLPKGYLDLAPDLVAEVVLPSDDPDAIQAKVNDWLDAGTQMVLVVYPGSRQMAVYRSLRQVIVLTESDTLEAPDLLPKFSMPLSAIFNP